MLSEPKRLVFEIPSPLGGGLGWGQSGEEENVNVEQASPPPSLPPTGGGVHRVVCYQWGNDNAPRTVLCVHGLTRNGRDFDFLSRALVENYRVICPDMPGRGESDWLANPLGYNYPAYVADMGFIIKSLGLTQVDWVGTSMGGIIGMMMANAVPGLIRALVLNDIGCVLSAAGIKRIMSYPASKNPCPSRAEAEATMRERCATFGIREEAHWQHMFTYGLQEKNGCWRAAYDPAIMAAYSTDRDKEAAVADLDLWGLWEAVTKIPVLLIRGAESDLLSRETALAMQSRHPNLTLREIPGCGHAPALMEDSQIMMVKDWLLKR